MMISIRVNPVELQKIDEQVKLKSRWSRGVGDGPG
jgi:hypothetical protein